jgi:hypothetical protein
MVPPTGFEPVTSSLPMMRSTAGAMRAIKLDRPLGIEPRLSRIKIWRVANYTMAEQSFTNSAFLPSIWNSSVNIYSRRSVAIIYPHLLILSFIAPRNILRGSIQ